MDETAAVTPPAAGNGGGPRLSAKLRLSVRRRSKPASSSLSTSSPGQETPSAPSAEVVDQEMLDLSERRRALFQPLGPLDSSSSAAAASPEQQLLQPPPDFEPSSNPRDWVLGKKRKLVNVDVVESMRRIAVQEMNRKDREICGLNEQLEEDGRTMELLQMQMQQERAKRLQTERECAVLRGQVTMLMNILQETEEAEAVMDDDHGGQAPVGDHHHGAAAAAASHM